MLTLRSHWDLFDHLPLFEVLYAICPLYTLALKLCICDLNPSKSCRDYMATIQRKFRIKAYASPMGLKVTKSAFTSSFSIKDHRVGWCKRWGGFSCLHLSSSSSSCWLRVNFFTLHVLCSLYYDSERADVQYCNRYVSSPHRYNGSEMLSSCTLAFNFHHRFILSWLV